MTIPSLHRFALAAVVSLVIQPSSGLAHDRARTPVRIPDIPGYHTLKCDFHIHTVFSDGSVWPNIRAEEAWREGLDAIAITDHIEYQPHKADLATNHNRSFEIARPAGDDLQLIVIRGSEITRAMPPGHLNAVFLTDARKLSTNEWRDAIRTAHGQGAFLFWNHPGWTGQQPDGVARWYPEHTEILQQGMLHGIEVVNGRSYYSKAHAWCLEHNLTLMSNSDVHNPIGLDYDLREVDHRPLTLVFAKERSADAIKEALFAHRTAVYSGNLLIGRESFIRPIFDRSIELLNPGIRLRAKQRVYLQIHNTSDLRYEMEVILQPRDVTVSSQAALPPGKTVLFEVRAKAEIPEGRHELRIPVRVNNLLVAPDQPLESELRINVEFVQ